MTGSIHMPNMSPHLPIGLQQIADAVAGAVEAGAAIVPLQSRDLRDGRPVQTADAIRAFVGDIKARCQGVINIATGGVPTMTDRGARAAGTRTAAEVALLNMGSMNFGLFPMLGRYKEFQHDWEQSCLDSTGDLVFKVGF